jgi:glycosyltransferase involved in cell wall biosynthesis
MTNRLKVLLSAYACEPNSGSEAGIGWSWAVEAARLGYEVYVLTHGLLHAPKIEAYREQHALPNNLHFVYINIPWVGYGLKNLPRMLRAHCWFWQWAAYHTARRLNRDIGFDLVHHITWGTTRIPSLMGELGIPFIFGPAGGGENAPWRLRLGYSRRGWIADVLRDLSNWFARTDPLVRRTFRKARRIYVTSEQTKDLLPADCRAKATVQLAIGIERQWLQRPVVWPKVSPGNGRSPRLIFVGRLLDWKGMHLGLPAFAQLTRRQRECHLTIIGQGPANRGWRELADRLRISEHLSWIPWLDREALVDHYQAHHVFFFPSLHDTGGFVVLEAMALGLPVVCLDLGGPGKMVDDACGRLVSTRNVSWKEVVAGLADALTEIVEDSDLYLRLSAGARGRANEFEWSQVVKRVYHEGARIGDLVDTSGSW